MNDSEAVQADFDCIALLADNCWNHNNYYHGFLLQYAPSHCAEALDIGCGTGAFARLLAARADHVLALDLSPNMIQIATGQSTQYPNLDFRVADVMAWEFSGEQFDCIASIATFHHLCLAEILPRLKNALRPGGKLLVLDLYRGEGLADQLTSILALPASIALRWLKTRRLRDPKEVRAAWDAHGRHDSYLTPRQVRQVCAALLPGARVTKHLLWRYSVIWRKQGQDPLP